MPHRQRMTQSLSIILIILGIILAFNWGYGFNLGLFFGALALASFIRPMGSPNAREVYNGLMGACWLGVLALFFWSGSWVWFLVGGFLSWFLDSKYKPRQQRKQHHAQTQAQQQEPLPYTAAQDVPDERDYPAYNQGYSPQERNHQDRENQKFPYTPYAVPSQTSSSPYPSSELPEAQYPQQLPPQSP